MSDMAIKNPDELSSAMQEGAQRMLVHCQRAQRDRDRLANAIRDYRDGKITHEQLCDHLPTET